ncbi:DNA-3-methyladenine glycosylase I [Gimibacter soli]|uniref:DNA-3-methyladenine glycosylase I n=1 Tax=Gimibacter soli TaxID=3024400 RepID=A0AAE9XTR1_9PROT|nr:DNA-3-methyladenine glycosylase I [Gimibacter soli]WCL54200.1 DNA-3-methyladenine glycosylase I [Gimibacter soli]
MRSFDQIWAIAAKRKGGDAALAAKMPEIKTADELAATPDDRILAAMTRAVFSAGFSWQVIEHKWPGFEEAFEGFNPVRCMFLDDDDLGRLVSDTRIVRNGVKIRSVRENAAFLCALADEHGSAARAIADWPGSDFMGLLDMIKKRASRLGGTSGQYFLRFIGKDGFVLGRDVVAALVREGVVDKEPTSKAAKKAVQDAFNTWAVESGRPLAHISRVLAMSIDA